MAKVLAVLTLIAILTASGCDCSKSRNWLLVEKRILNEDLVQGREILIEYRLHNIGTHPIKNISLTDDDYDESIFTIIRGSNSFHLNSFDFSRHDEMKNAFVHALVVKTKQFQSDLSYNFRGARVNYTVFGDFMEGQSSEPSFKPIITDKKFRKKHKLLTVEWCFFGIVVAPLVLGPYFLWNYIRKASQARK